MQDVFYEQNDACAKFESGSVLQCDESLWTHKSLTYYSLTRHADDKFKILNIDTDIPTIYDL